LLVSSAPPAILRVPQQRARQEGGHGGISNSESSNERTDLKIARAVCEAVEASDELIESVEATPEHDYGDGNGR
jgi:hypothetical protein